VQDCGSSGGQAPPPPNDISVTGSGQTRREMDHLVKEIKENLKLADHHLSVPPPPSLPSLPSCGGKIKSTGSSRGYSGAGVGHHRVRASPYHVPPSSRQCDSNGAPSSGGGSGGASVGAGGGNEAAAMTLAMRRKQRQGWGRRRYPSTCMNNNAKLLQEVGGAADDPFAMLQELISDGSLIKEAVRRLQDGFSGMAGSPVAGRLTPGSGNNRAGSGRQTAYDSDSDNEDCRTPPEIRDEEDQQRVVQQEGGESGAAVAGNGTAVSGGGSSSVRSSVHAVSSSNMTFPCCEVGL